METTRHWLRQSARRAQKVAIVWSRAPGNPRYALEAPTVKVAKQCARLVRQALTACLGLPLILCALRARTARAVYRSASLAWLDTTVAKAR